MPGQSGVSESPASSEPAMQAFVLGAGLGTRLRPLTEALPKPLVPVWNRPLLAYALDHLRADLGILDFLVNTHHCPEAYGTFFGDGRYRDARIAFRHEPVLLDTGGGIDNIRDWLPDDQSFAVYNGDLLTDLPLAAARDHHLREGNAVTLLLRSRGDELRVGFDPGTGRVVDLRGELRPDWPERYQFAGVYFLSPGFLRYLEPGRIESVVLAFLRAIRDGARVGGYVEDAGEWSDLGERRSYLEASAMLAEKNFPRYGIASRREETSLRGEVGPPVRIHPDAEIDPGATVDAVSSIGPGCVVGAGARIERSVLWEGVTVRPGATLHRCVVRSGHAVERSLADADV